MREQLLQTLNRLKRPSVLLSIVSQVVTLLLLFGFDVNENLVMSVAAAGCSLLVTLGILSNPDTRKGSYGDDMLPCSRTGRLERHVLVNGKFVCAQCGAEYQAKA